MSTIKQPEFVEFCAVPVIEAAAEGKDLPRFSMVAYSGGQMRIAGFPHAVVVDLSGLDVPNQSVPIRLDHKSNQGVGHTTRIEAHDGQLIAEGLISRETSWARDVARSGTNGFPWQASIGGPVIEAEFVPDGRTVEVNGRKFEGPLHVVRRMTLKEISFVDSGADADTKAVVAASEKENEKENDCMSKTATVKENAKDDAQAAEGRATEGQAVVTAPEVPAALEASEKENMVATLRADMRKAAADETRRITEIRNICDGQHPEIEAKAIDEGWGLTSCELAVLLGRGRRYGQDRQRNGRQQTDRQGHQGGRHRRHYRSCSTEPVSQL